MLFFLNHFLKYLFRLLLFNFLSRQYLDAFFTLASATPTLPQVLPSTPTHPTT